MICVQTTDALREYLKASHTHSLAFVPTMGNLHDGHIALMEKAKQCGTTVVVSIFVNPLQFGLNEDLEQYPRTLANDQAILQRLGVDVLFAPQVNDFYPNGLAQQTRVEVPLLGQQYCGASRSYHFVGVTTVVCKLLNIVQPHTAVFGKKDYQQWFMIRRMVLDLAMPVDIIGVDTVRETDGLAMSSRNQYLTQHQRQQAPLLYQQLSATAEALKRGEESVDALCQKVTHQLNQASFVTDYIAIADADTLAPLTHASRSAVILVAAYLGNTRLVDNFEVDLMANR